MCILHMSFFLLSNQVTAEEKKSLDDFRVFSNSFAPSLYDLPPALTVYQLENEKEVPAQVSDSLNKIPGLINIQSPLVSQSASQMQYRGLSSEYFEIRWNDLPNLNFTGVQPAFEPRFLNREGSSQITYIQGAQSLYYGGGSLGGLIRLDKNSEQDENYQLTLGEYRSSDVLFERNFKLTSSEDKSTRQKFFIGGKTFSTNGLSQTRDAIQTEERDKQRSQSVSFIYESEGVSHNKVVFNYSEQKQDDDTFLRDDKNAYSRVNAAQVGYFWRSDSRDESKFLKKVDLELNFYQSDYFNFSDSVSADYYKSQFAGVLGTIRPSLKWQGAQNEMLQTAHQVGLQLDSETQSVHELNSHEPEFNKKGQLLRAAVFYIGQLQMSSQGSAQIALQPSVWNLNYGLRVEPDINNKTFLGAHMDLQKDIAFLRLSKGFKRPSFYQLYSKYGNRQLNPQEVVLKEVGIKHNFVSWLGPGSEQYAEAKLFHIDFKDLISYSTSRFENINRASSEGVELIFHMDWNSSFYLYENFVYVRTQDQSRQVLLRKPLQTLKSRGGYRHSKWQLELIHMYLGKREDIDENLQRNTLKPQQILDFNSEYKLFTADKVAKDLIVLFFRINNLLDSATETLYGTPIAPRNVTLGLQYKN